MKTLAAMALTIIIFLISSCPVQATILPAEEKGYDIYTQAADAWRQGQFDAARQLFREALHTYLSDPGVPPNRIADAYNAMGAMMWLATRLDSAEYFYSRSINVIQNMEGDSLEKKYLSSVTMANVALVQQARGRSGEAMETLHRIMVNYQDVIDHHPDPERQSRALLFQLRAMSNLASFYNDLGNHKKAHDLLTYIYASQQTFLPPGDTELYKTLIRVGESQMALREYRHARNTLMEALEMIERSADNQLYWKGIALSNLAQTEEALGNDMEAMKHFREGTALFDRALGSSFDRHYLFFLNKLALFYARMNMTDEAVDAASQAYRYARIHAGENSPLAIKHMAGMAEIHTMLKQYDAALTYANTSYELIQIALMNSPNLSDSLQLQRQLIPVLVSKTVALYHNEQNKDVDHLRKLYEDLQQGAGILDARKALFPATENTRAIADENQPLYDWLKRIGLELYRKTGDPQFLGQAADFHESGIYHTIRMRFYQRNNIGFQGVPDSLIRAEEAMRRQLSAPVANDNKNGQYEASPAKLLHQRTQFLDDLKRTHPAYYAMRYAPIQGVIAQLQARLDNKTTVVRYFFAGEALYGLVVNRHTSEVFQLPYEAVKNHIARLNSFLPESTGLTLLFELYQALWEPLAGVVHSGRLVIIPDRELFNLAFEALPLKKINSYSELAGNSLLGRHSISYHYSLAMINPGADTRKGLLAGLPALVGGLLNRLTGNTTHSASMYMAFAPGFFDNLKQAYKEHASTGPAHDKTYLSLLPQPFIYQAAKRLRKRLGGQVYTDFEATRGNFILHAGKSNILHIGTHAEANNLGPDLSRLIFAKDLSQDDPSYENDLYAWELYGLDLNAELTVLTACETGKPAYRPGEGMISMAHAFDYAGSKSMLTSLWRIDEQVSADITEKFFRYLERGYSKDRALQQAKLDYLRQAEGRTLAPAYWAGMIIMGDTSPIPQKRNGRKWAAAMIVILTIGYGIKRFRK